MHILGTIIKKHARITRRAAALLFALAAALAVRHFAASYYAEDAVDDIKRDLVTINSYKNAQVTDWLERHQREAERLSRHPFLGELITEEIARPGARRAQLTAWLQDHTKQKRYISMAFLSPKGATITATPGYITEIDPHFKKIFDSASKTGTALLTDLYLGAAGKPRMAMLSPISAGGRGGSTLCVLVIKIDPDLEFYPLVEAAPLLFAKAETLLVRKEGDRALFLNGLAYKKDSALKFSLPLSSADLPAAAALKGNSGFFVGTDYHGAKVFSALSPVKVFNWSIITKVGQDIILAPARTKGALASLLITLAALLLAGAVYAGIFLRKLALAEALRKAEVGLRGSEQIFREFMEHSPVYVFFKDENIRPIHLSRNFEKLLGRPLHEILGRTMDELFPSDLAKSMIADDQRIIREGKEVVVEEELDGRSYRTIKFPIHIEGKPSYLAGYTIDITEQKQAQKIVDQTNERLARLTEQVPGVVYQYRLYPDGRSCFPYASSGINDIYEVTPEEVREDATPVFGRIHPDDLKGTSEAIFESARNNSIFHWEFRVVLPRQGLRWRLCDAKPERLPDGSTLWYGIIADITQRKLGEELLSLNAQRTRTLLQLNQMTEATEKEITDFALEEAVKLSRSKIGYLAFLNEDESVLTMHSWSKSAMAECATAEKPLIYPVAATGLWGEAVRQRQAVITNDYAAPSPLKKGCPQGHVALKRHMNVPVFAGPRIVIVAGLGNKEAEYDQSDVQHLTLLMEGMWRLLERKRAVEALRQSSALMKSTQELARIGGWEWDLANKDMHWTEETYHIHGFAPGSIEPSPEAHIARSQECYRPEDRRMVMEAFDRCARTGVPYDFELPFTDTQGRQLWVHTTGKAEQEEGRVVKLLGTLQDITHRKLAELALEKLNKDLFEKKQEMENFLYITTHDLRSPLVNIQGFSQNLERYIRELVESVAPAPLPEEARETLRKLAGERIPEALAYVQESSRKMDALISALLKVSRMGRVEMKPERVDMNALLQKILDSLRYQLEGTGGKIHIGTLPPCKADAGAVNQLFSNLLDNAIKYRHKDRPVDIKVAGEVKGDRVVYTVGDNGAGIPEEDLPKIWNVFYRTREAVGKKGEGIGLPMVKRIIEKNGGSIKAESRAGEGSVFRVELPAAPEV
jgi:PAS domain S-box-containing protein